MLIDWFTVVAQAFNFLILVWLLRRFLYKPILDAIDAREKRIAAELAEAEAKKDAAGRERDAFARRNEEFDRQSAALWSEAMEGAAAERERLLDEARKEADALRAKRQEALQTEYHNLNEEITRRTGAEVFSIARKTLVDLAATSLEERMTDLFISRLRELTAEDQHRLQSVLGSESAPVIVCTAFALPEPQRRAIEGVVRGMIAPETQVRFETAAELVSGIELTANGYKIAWSIGNYLAALNESVAGLLREHRRPETKTAAQPSPRTDEHGT